MFLEHSGGNLIILVKHWMLVRKDTALMVHVVFYDIHQLQIRYVLISYSFLVWLFDILSQRMYSLCIYKCIYI